MFNNKSINESILISRKVQAVTPEMIYSVSLRKFYGVKFYSSVGLIAVDMIMSTVLVESGSEKVEFVAGVSSKNAIDIINDIKGDVHIEDMHIIYDECVDRDQIDIKIEHLVKKGQYTLIEKLA